MDAAAIGCCGIFKPEASLHSRNPSACAPYSFSSSCSYRMNLIRIREYIARCELGSGVSGSDGGVSDQRLDSPPVSSLEQLRINGADRYKKERSSIVVIGLGVHAAPVEMREKLAIPEAEWPQAIRELCSLNHVKEAAVFGTYNRTEIYVVALSQHCAVKEVTKWMSKKSGLPESELSKHRFLLYNKDAVEHLFKVSSGLDSPVPGECQILGQVKQVVKVAAGVDGFGRSISGLFKHAITVGKRVRTETSIASGAVSDSSAAVELAVMKIPERAEFASARILVVGAGQIGKHVIRHLVAKGCKQLSVASRNRDKVADIYAELKGVEIIYIPFDQLFACAAEMDIVFTCTASETPLFLKQRVDNFPLASHVVDGTRIFIDLSLPRNVDPSVGDSKGVKVYNVDDLKELVDANMEGRLREAIKAQAIVTDEVRRFEDWKNSLETVPMIKKLRASAERIRRVKLEDCLSKLGKDVPEKTKRAVDDLSRDIVESFLHGPMKHLRCDSANGRTLSLTLNNMHVLNRIFALETELSEEKRKAKVEQSNAKVAFWHDEASPHRLKSKRTDERRSSYGKKKRRSYRKKNQEKK